MRNKIEKTMQCIMCNKEFRTISTNMCDECLEKDPRVYCSCCKGFKLFNLKDKSKVICANCGHIVEER